MLSLQVTCKYTGYVLLCTNLLTKSTPEPVRFLHLITAFL